MIDHVSIGVSNLERSIAFYDAVFASLGIIRLWTTEDAAGYGYDGSDEPFAIKQATGRALLGHDERAHIAFQAANRDVARAFHARALEHGGTDEGVPGLHPEYGPGYFAAFVRDPDGHRLEAVRHESRGA
jgi:catechol 2,3-dioxygenase-like lactoylglutathione lyase family enzyme